MTPLNRALCVVMGCSILANCSAETFKALPPYAVPWQREVVYQIYPRSFADSDGDGMGDLGGILSKVDYLEKLGVTTVWLSPIYRTTHYDNGYDITDYLDIDPLFGTLAEWQTLLTALHQRHIKLVMDLVVNHSSDEHPWFQQEVRYKVLQRQLAAFTPPLDVAPDDWNNTMRHVLTDTTTFNAGHPEHTPYASAAAAVLAFRAASERATYAGYPSAQVLLERLALLLYGSEGERAALPPNTDFYIWQDKPLNWRSCFDGPAWHLNAATAKFYLALFSPHQPDLNWSNPEMRRAVESMLSVWVDRGVDGFRMDVIDLIGKDKQYVDAPVPPGQQWGSADAFFVNQPVAHTYLYEMIHASLNPNLRTVGELTGITPEDSLEYTSPERDELNEGILSSHMDADHSGQSKYTPSHFDLPAFKRSITQQQQAIHGRGWIANYLENHDQLRSVSRYGQDGALRIPSAKMLATLLFTLEGTPYVYQGQEIGMTNASFNSIDEIQDVEASNFYKVAVASGMNPTYALNLVSAHTRDNVRTAMQWNNKINAGFSVGRPWTKVNPNYVDVNVEADLADPESIIAYYRDLMGLRQRHQVLVYGKYEEIDPDNPYVFSYTRTLGQDVIRVLLNFTNVTQGLSQPIFPGEQILISNYPAGDLRAALRPYEARVYANF